MLKIKRFFKLKDFIKIVKKNWKMWKKVEKEKSEKLENFFLKNNQLYLNECIYKVQIADECTYVIVCL